jgi:hypothetical protein
VTGAGQCQVSIGSSAVPAIAAAMDDVKAIPGHLAPLDARDGSCWVQCEDRGDERAR